MNNDIRKDYTGAKWGDGMHVLVVLGCVLGLLAVALVVGFGKADGAYCKDLQAKLADVRSTGVATMAAAWEVEMCGKLNIAL